jgi:hypothetical protein
MSMFWLAFAAQLSAPTPINLPRWFQQADVPIEELRADEMKLVQFRVTVTPQGKLQDCQVEVSSGNPKIDRLTCGLVKRRAGLRAATGIDGQPAYGVYRAFITWWMGLSERTPSPVTTRDMEVLVANLPRGIQSPAPVKLMFAVDTGGHPSSCTGERQADHPALVKIGCDQLVKNFTAVPARTTVGIPVPSVQNAIVLFVKN